MLPTKFQFICRVSEEKIKMWKVNGQWTPSDDKSSHSLPWARWAKKANNIKHRNSLKMFLFTSFQKKTILLTFVQAKDIHTKHTFKCWFSCSLSCKIMIMHFTRYKIIFSTQKIQKFSFQIENNIYEKRNNFIITFRW